MNMNRKEYITNFFRLILNDLCMWCGVCMVALGANMLYPYDTVFNIFYHFGFVFFFYLISIPIVYVIIHGLPINNENIEIFEYERMLTYEAKNKKY